jgi:hypothetical protein
MCYITYARRDAAVLQTNVAKESCCSSSLYAQMISVFISVAVAPEKAEMICALYGDRG